jgi:NADH-quinone oxidoreductase subunit M
VFAILFGLAVKTPLVPVHTWLPPAHVDAPGPASTILAGVLLKMGTFGMIRIPLAMARDTFAAFSLPLAIVAVVSIVYGALVAMGQNDLKRRIAYTSVNHMGYAVLGIAVAGAVAGRQAARDLALTGAVVEMVAHGLITGALFLLAGSVWQRTGDYQLDHYGGLAAPAPRFAGATTLAAFASLGLPGLAGFVAEFQIFVGTFAVYPVLAGIGLLGVLITAALFLQMLQQLFFGEIPDRLTSFSDLGARETTVLVVLLALVVLIGVWPTWLLDLVTSSSGLLLDVAGAG